MHSLVMRSIVLAATIHHTVQETWTNWSSLEYALNAVNQGVTALGIKGMC